MDQQPQPELILFGGTFDPPHAGHVACAALARDAFPKARLKIVPSPAPPIAGGTSKRPIADFEARVAMCRLAFPGADIDRLEAELPAPSYTVHTLQTLAARHAGTRLAWLLGADQLHSFAGWREPQAILDLADLLVVSRPGSAPVSLALPGGLRGVVHHLGSVASPAASTQIRACLSSGEPVPHGWLPEAVARYLADHRLYTPTQPVPVKKDTP